MSVLYAVHVLFFCNVHVPVLLTSQVHVFTDPTFRFILVLALMRERDEILAMMDAKERLQYDRHKTSTNDAYLHNSLAQVRLNFTASCLGTVPSLSLAFLAQCYPTIFPREGRSTGSGL